MSSTELKMLVFTYLLPAYKTAIDFCVYLIPVSLLNSLISFKRVFVFIFIDSLGFSMWTIMSSANRENFIPSFLIYKLFISFFLLSFFFCFIELARTSSTVMNER